MFIGGEFYEDTAWATDTPAPPVANALFLNGGRASLSVIARYLTVNKYKQVLLPTYLCPSILDVFDQHTLKYSFYKINEDLSIDLDDLLKKAANYQAIYFINYFGFEHSFETLAVLKQLQAAGMLLVEDNAQSGVYLNYFSDFSFNSMRKICAYDGSYLATRNYSLDSYIDTTYHQNNRLPLIREYRNKLRLYLFNNYSNLEDLDRLFYQAERYYEQDGVILGDANEQRKIEQLDWQSIKAVRRSNYSYLLEQIGHLPGLTPIYPILQADIMPLGLPVYISGISRDKLAEKLSDERISLTVHWDALLSDPRTQSDLEVIKMAKHIITLPVDQYTNKSQLEYLIDHLTNLVLKIQPIKPIPFNSET